MPDSLTQNTQSNFSETLAILKKQQRHAISAGIFARIIQFYFVTVIASLFLGFVTLFPFGEDSFGFFGDFTKVFMITVLCIVIFSIIHKAVRQWYKDHDTSYFILPSVFASLLLSAAAILASWLIGYNYLKVDFGFTFFIRYAGGIFSVFLLILPYQLAASAEKKFISQYRSGLIDFFMQDKKEKFTYLPNAFIPREEFEESKVFSYQEIFTYAGEGLFSSSENTFHGSRLDVKEIEHTVSNGKSETKISDLFRGYFFTSAFSKPFHGETYIVPDLSRELLGEIYGEAFNQWIHKKGVKLVTMEDPVFEKLFSVYATDEVEARYILSTSLIEKITALKNALHSDVFISFVNQKIFIAVQQDKDILGPNLFGNLGDEEYLRKQLGFLSSLLSIPESLNLNAKVWG